MSKTIVFIAAVVMTFSASLNGQEPNQDSQEQNSTIPPNPELKKNAWEHFFRIVVADEVVYDTTGKGRPFAELYLESSFLECPKEPENRPLTSVQKQDLIILAKSFISLLDSRKSELANALGRELSNQAEYGELVDQAIQYINPDIRELVRRHVEKKIWPKVKHHPSGFSGIMGDPATVYTGHSLLSNGTFSVYGNVAGGYSYHQYAVALEIITPKNRQVSSPGVYQTGSSSNTIFLPPDFTDLGQYKWGSEFPGFCQLSHAAFVLFLWAFEYQTFSVRKTYYTNAITVAGGCAYGALACTTGIPTCTLGLGLDLTFSGGCAPIAWVEYLVMDGTVCGPVGLYGAWNGEVRACN